MDLNATTYVCYLCCFSCLEKCVVDQSQFVNECFGLYESCETYMERVQVSCYG